jgi:tRNA nucleotidyltransferase/poly(A) polymerase
MLTEYQRKVVEIVSNCAAELSLEIYVVGGVVRDLFIFGDLIDRDIDFLVDKAQATQLAELVATKLRQGQVVEFKDFLTAKLINLKNIPGISELDFAAARKEIYPAISALPKVEAAQLKEDLKRRDFTINAMALPLSLLTKKSSLKEISEQVIDLFQGMEDLKKKLIRVLHAKSFVDDPTRIFRGARYVERLAGRFSDETERYISQALYDDVLRQLSPSRVLIEIKKILNEKAPLKILSYLIKLGISDSLKFSQLEEKSQSYFDTLRMMKLNDRHLISEVSLMLLLKAMTISEEKQAFIKEFSITQKILRTMQNAEEKKLQLGAISPPALVYGAVIGRGEEWGEAAKNAVK